MRVAMQNQGGKSTPGREQQGRGPEMATCWKFLSNSEEIGMTRVEEMKSVTQ